MAVPEILNVPPEEAVRHFRAKGYHVGFDWRDTAAAQHLKSFTVAKAMRLDVLEGIRTEVDRAIADGTTLREFKANLEPFLRSKGWWGRQQLLDPVTGQLRTVQLGSPRRLEIIFDTNLRTSYAHGEWQRIQRVKDRRPWLRYVAVRDARTRPQHLRWHGIVLPVDHPFWRTHFPPNGWFCRCSIQQLSDADLEEMGIRPTENLPAGWDDTRPWTNHRTGQVQRVPRGIDPGFGHNVGQLDQVEEAVGRLQEKITAAAPDLAAAARVRELDDFVVEGRRQRKRLVEEAGGLAAPDLPERFRARLRRRLVDERGAGTVEADIGAAPGGSRTAARVREAARILPASWVEAGNKLPVNGIRGSKRGFYRQAWGGRAAEVSVAKDVGNPLHEYHHHLQRAIPGLDAHFAKLHRRRTAGEKRVPIGGGVGRKDEYIRPYTGREYGGGETPLEVLTMAVQMLFHPVWGREHLRQMVHEDPELLDLTLGVLFHYNP